MYIPAAFRETRPEVLHELIREHSFATLVSRVDGELFATHMPFLLDSTRGANGTLRGHMARANPHWRSFLQLQPERECEEALVIFQGPHAYISPNWYLAEQAVPTWNYSAVHAYGTPVLLDDWAHVRNLLEDTVQTFESGLPERWSTARAGEDYIARLGQAIVAFEIPITRLEGKRKLSQNRPSDIESAAAGLRAHGDATGQLVAEQMLHVARSLH
ncbi:MAG: FMN-binding negative transcriptional regulator [Chloroflexi bacterium]|nr:FMN-binding negative transcriptional regulator [Chloroflexota bacterium]